MIVITSFLKKYILCCETSLSHPIVTSSSVWVAQRPKEQCIKSRWWCILCRSVRSLTDKTAAVFRNMSSKEAEAEALAATIAASFVVATVSSGGVGYKNEELTIVFRTLDDLPTVKLVLRVNLNHVKKESSTGKCIGKSQILPDSDVFKRIFTFSDTEEKYREPIQEFL